MKRPAFQFYPADWRKDADLQSCSIGARGLWIEMLCVMHECAPYGHLCVNGRPMTDEQLARLVGESVKSTAKWLSELESAAVFSKDDQGRIYSRRMVKDERLRNIRAEAGAKGGNPALLGLKDKQKVNQTDNHQSNQRPTPSSSSSSSSSNQGTSPPSGAKAPDPVKDEIWKSGKALLVGEGKTTESAGSFLGKLCKDFGQVLVLDAVRDCVRATPAKPSEWLMARCQERRANAGNKQVGLEKRNRHAVSGWKPPELREPKHAAG